MWEYLSEYCDRLLHPSALALPSPIPVAIANITLTPVVVPVRSELEQHLLLIINLLLDHASKFRKPRWSTGGLRWWSSPRDLLPFFSPPRNWRRKKDDDNDDDRGTQHIPLGGRQQCPSSSNWEVRSSFAFAVGLLLLIFAVVVTHIQCWGSSISYFIRVDWSRKWTVWTSAFSCCVPISAQYI